MIKKLYHSVRAITKNEPMGLYSGGLIFGRIFASEIWGFVYIFICLFITHSYFRNFTVLVFSISIVFGTSSCRFASS